VSLEKENDLKENDFESSQKAKKKSGVTDEGGRL